MRVAIVAAKYPYGPQEAYLDRELRALAPHTAGIAVFPTSPSVRERGYRDIPAEVHRLGLISVATVAGAVTALVTRPAATVRAIAAVLSAHGRPGTKLKNLAVIPLGLAVGVALRRGRFEHVHSYWLSTPATVAYIAAAVAGIPWSSTAHLWDIYEENAPALKLRSARFIRAISARGRADLLAAVPDIPPERITVLHVGVDVPDRAPSFALRQAQGDIGIGGIAGGAQGDIGIGGIAGGAQGDIGIGGIAGGAQGDIGIGGIAGGAQGDIGIGGIAGGAQGDIRILCAANLVVKKGHADLLRAVAAVREGGAGVRLTLAGDGELRGELEALVRDLHLDDSVTFRGYVGHDTLLEEIRAGSYDVMALTSLELPGGVMEGIPVALMEAMALGLPVVTTSTGSITELVDDGCGRVVPQGDVMAIAGALRELADPALRARLADAAHARVRAEFDVVTVAGELARLIGASASVTGEHATGRLNSEDARTTEGGDAAWGQG
jgi:glycosyltransferase involved in cell wall biosynthesis